MTQSSPLPLGARVLTAGALALPTGIVVDGWVVIDGERVLAAGGGTPPERPSWSVPGLVVPGFVDVHVHGGGGASFDGGVRSDVERVVRTHLEHGTTTMVASLVTASVDALAASCAGLAALAEEGVVAGIHLEGPWLSPRRAGAHEPSLLLPPTLEAVDRLVEASRGHLRMVTLAPELPGALVAIPELVAAGVVVAIGHTDATYDETRAALHAGATAGTHLFNAMPPLHHREPGPVTALLESSAYVELVADGVHVHPSVLALAWRDGRTALVTDAMAAAGAADGDYRLGSLTVEVRDGVARLPTTGAIAASTATLASSLTYAVSVAGIPLPDALAAITSTPAAMLGLTDVGVIAPGAYADLVELSDDLEVDRVMRRGAWVPLS
ncbi:N-acetylglucosamine-6-phosphate deacetylase [Nocardioides halotolerans]|uniref:N-acetylglucosamine-6-phosphate deacetylase n=1 Tax=Nocardioides halotolerans TaxID=433660 RepID=UPI000560FC4A|nr:N-acetylglucosamine-6-phosphate deacetylase [Nocardioides halotolerans]